MIRVKHVTQPTAHSCVHACLSMVTAIPVTDLIDRLGDSALSDDCTATILTENGILPISLPGGTPHMMPYCGVYFVTVPSINLPGVNHQVVVSYENDEWVLYDPNDGYEGRKSYPRDSFINPPELFGYGGVVYLHALPQHKGGLKRIERYYDNE